MAELTRLNVVAQDIADPIYAVGELGATFREVKWLEWPAVYEEEGEYWVLVEENGAPKGIVYCDDGQYLGTHADEALRDRIERIDSSALIAASTPLLDLLTLFSARSCSRYYLLTAGRVTHWLEDWHLSRPPARLALLGACLDLEAALEALIMLSSARYLTDAARNRLKDKLTTWGYGRSKEHELGDWALVRCADFREKWLMLQEHEDIVGEAINFLPPDSTKTRMHETVTFRNGLVHGHAVLPVSPLARLTEPIPTDQHRNEADHIVGLIKVMEHMTQSVRHFVDERTPRRRP